MPRAESPLKTYHEKRDFTRTPEPKGGALKKKSKGLAYVIQKHDATRLHFDFRLELDGVLMSWAVTRGPSLNPADKRLAVRTENHPIEYGDFEGVIPSGYGAGTVMLWDRGTWTPITDPHEGLAKGNFKFTLHGERLKGGFALIRMQKRRGEKQESWLLIKERDEFMDREFDPVAHWDDSVKSGRDFAALEKSEDTWTKEGGAGKKNGKAPAKSPRAKAKTVKRTLKFIKPQLATARDEPPTSDDWLHEIKFDGYRMIALIEGGEARLITRNEIDWTQRYQPIADALGDLKVTDAIIDGELVALDENGRSKFGALQDINAGARAHNGDLAFYAFDLLRLDGQDLTKQPLLERKEQLRKVLGKKSGRILYSDHVVGDGPAVLENATTMKLEGVVSKKASAPYISGRTQSWIKVKAISNDEFVVGGYRKSSIRGRPFASLLLGEYVDGELQYRGRVGTGFDEKTLSAIGARLALLKRDKSPFAKLPAEAKQAAAWVDPKLVAQIAYTERTSDGSLRHPSFLGLREDKKAKEVRTPANVRAPVKRKDGPSEVLGVRLTNPDRIYYPKDGITKLQVVEYYAAHSKRVLPHITNRPLSIVRCPDGLEGERFFQKHLNASTPKQIKSIMIREKEGKSPYLMIDDAQGLVAAAQIAALELHVWGVRADNIERPERVVFDLDPDEDLAFATVTEAAFELRDVLAAADLKSFPMITGGKGIHVIAPIERRSDWEDVKGFCRALAQALAKAAPDRYLAAASKARRKGKIFIDWMRNERGSTAIAPYSLRARDGAPIATPVTWPELKHLDSAAEYTLANIDRRLAKADPWAGYFDVRQGITKSNLKALGV